MNTVQDIKSMQRLSREWHAKGKSIAFVPTMGYLHAGHLSLVEVAKEKADIVVVSIFVNPLQFSPIEDLNCYPQDFIRDKTLCSDAGVTTIFHPSNDEMYSADYSTQIVENQLSKPLCGKSRPTHFPGVTTVVCKLFLAVLPDIAVFGRKDAQQALVIKRMVRDLNFPIEVIVTPTVREIDGLAMSSRNKYLDAEERKNALSIHRGLGVAEEAYDRGERSSDALRRLVKNEIEETGGTVDYIEFVDEGSLATVDRIEKPVLVAVAAKFGDTRLIDNCTLG